MSVFVSVRLALQAPINCTNRDRPFQYRLLIGIVIKACKVFTAPTAAAAAAFNWSYSIENYLRKLIKFTRQVVVVVSGVVGGGA